MSLGTATVRTRVGHDRGDNLLKAARMSFAGDTSYPTGGTASFKSFVEVALGRKIKEVVDVVSASCGDNRLEYDHANDKLFVRVISTAAEVANTTNQSATTFNCTVLYH
jgi:hypothetical protein